MILDEAYVEFQIVEDPDTSLDLLRRFPNLVILRTFSKVYGLAGLRVGYALGPEEFVHAVDRVRQPFAVNHLAQAAATEALRHQDDVARRVEWNAAERLWMEEELAELGFDVADSQANFCWVGLGELDEGEVMPRLGRAGVAVRPGKGLGGPGHVRVTYGTRAENERFVEALRACLDYVAAGQSRDRPADLPGRGPAGIDSPDPLKLFHPDVEYVNPEGADRPWNAPRS